jgi:hypothetical protein
MRRLWTVYLVSRNPAKKVQNWPAVLKSYTWPATTEPIDPGRCIFSNWPGTMPAKSLRFIRAHPDQRFFVQVSRWQP